MKKILGIPHNTRRHLANKKWREKSKDVYVASQRKTWLLRQYGLTIEEYDELLVAQGYVCAICGGLNPDNRRLAVDHCHKTGQVRGLLCDLCNRGLGLFLDEVTRLRQAAKYLEECSPDKELDGIPDTQV